MSTTPARRDLVARRNVPFGVTWRFANDNDTPFDLSAYSAALQIRYYQGAPGAALISLATVETDVQGIRIFPLSGEVQVMIAEATLAGLPGLGVPEGGDPQVFEYDLVMDNGSQDVWLSGTFTVYPGVTK